MGICDVGPKNPNTAKVPARGGGEGAEEGRGVKSSAALALARLLSSVAEQQLRKLKVSGSIPLVGFSHFFSPRPEFSLFLFS